MFLSRLNRDLAPVAPLSLGFEKLFEELEAPVVQGLNVWETNNELVVEVEMPGRRREDIDVSWKPGSMTVKSTHKAESELKDTAKKYLVRSSETKTFSRTVLLPDTVDPEKATAEYKDGVLVVTIPKAERARLHQIEVK